MSNLKDNLNLFKSQLFQLRHNVIFQPCFNMQQAMLNYINCAQRNLEINPVILLLNINQLNNIKLQRIMELIKLYHPHIVWIMESWTYLKPIPGYNIFYTKDMYRNHLMIRSDILRNRTVKEIKYGFQVDELFFRYIPPNSKPTELTQNEFGDFNLLSNKWIRKTGMVNENRYGKLGGMGYKSQYNTIFRFIKFPSDHEGIIVQFLNTWKKYLIADRYKTKDAVENAVITGKLGYIYKNSANYKPPRDSHKIINPYKQNLTLEPWKQLYNHNPNKPDPREYTPIVSSNEINKINSKAYDINNQPVKYILEALIGKPKEIIQRFIEVNKVNKFQTKTVCILKEGRKPDSVLNLRPIQVSPINFKLAEQSRIKLKEWMIKNTDKRIYSFLPGKSTFTCFEAIVNQLRTINDDG